MRLFSFFLVLCIAFGLAVVSAVVFVIDWIEPHVSMILQVTAVNLAALAIHVLVMICSPLKERIEETLYHDIQWRAETLAKEFDHADRTATKAARGVDTMHHSINKIGPRCELRLKASLWILKTQHKEASAIIASLRNDVWALKKDLVAASVAEAIVKNDEKPFEAGKTKEDREMNALLGDDF